MEIESDVDYTSLSYEELCDLHEDLVVQKIEAEYELYWGEDGDPNLYQPIKETY